MAAEPRSDSFRRVAAPWHTVFILALIAALAHWGKLRADQTRAVLNPDRVKIYERTILFEWLVLGVVLVGVWLNGSSLFAVLGDRWRSGRQFLRDGGIGLLFLIASIMVTSILGPHGNTGDKPPSSFFHRERSRRRSGSCSPSRPVFARKLSTGLLAETIHGADQECPGWHLFSRPGVRRGSLLSGLGPGFADRSDGSDERYSGLRVSQRAPGNDRAYAARCAWRLRQTLAESTCLESVSSTTRSTVPAVMYW